MVLEKGESRGESTAKFRAPPTPSPALLKTKHLRTYDFNGY
jgi:hypothetical protein